MGGDANGSYWNGRERGPSRMNRRRAYFGALALVSLVAFGACDTEPTTIPPPAGYVPTYSNDAGTDDAGAEDGGGDGGGGGEDAGDDSASSDDGGGDGGGSDDAAGNDAASDDAASDDAASDAPADH